MAQARGFGLNGAKYFTNVVTPREVLCTFTVASADTKGLGTTSVKSNGYIEAVFMHTSQTPGSVNGYVNPNPPAGYAYVLFRNSFTKFLGTYSSFYAPPTSTTTTSTTANSVYIITSLGTTTAAQWLAAGLPAGFAATVGQSFVAKATGAIGGTGTVGIPGVPTIGEVAIIGDPSTTSSNTNIAQNAGARVLLQFAAATSSSVTTLIPAAPVDGTIVTLSLMFDGSSVTIDGL